MTTGLVVSVTDELVAELEALASKATPGRVYDRLESAGGGIKYHCYGDDGSVVLQVDHKNGEFGFIGPKGEEDEKFFLACTPATILALLSERAELKRDAERYRWLVDGKRGDYCWQNVLSDNDRGDHADLEYAIDAAMQSEAKP